MSGTLVVPSTWRGRPAWLLRGGTLEAVVTATGAQLARLGFPGEELNPFWSPSWPSAARPDPAVHGDPAGEGLLLCSVAGSVPCIDRFGPPLPGEDRPFHGEACIAEWTLEGVVDGEARFIARLPRAGLGVRRALSFTGDACTLRTEAWGTDGSPHAIDWCEHATLGDPFLDGAAIDAGIDRIDGEPGSTGLTIAAALAMPRAGDPPRSDVRSGRVARGWWSAARPDLDRRLRATWDPADFPWLVVWTEHRNRTAPPWNGRERARGLELSTKPFPVAGPWPDAERFGRPTTCRIPAIGVIAKTVVFTWSAGCPSTGSPSTGSPSASSPSTSSPSTSSPSTSPLP